MARVVRLGKVMMHKSMIASAFVLAMLPSAASSKKNQSVAVQQQTAYKPGLGEIMLLTQARHLKLGLAGAAGNWALADYEIDELKEGLEDAGKLIPTYKGMPVGAMIESVMRSPISEMEKAIKAKEPAAFDAAFATLTSSCNACHQSANKAFIVIQQPRSESFPNQLFTTKP